MMRDRGIMRGALLVAISFSTIAAERIALSGIGDGPLAENGIIATASSSHPEYHPGLAIDGDPATIWHSEWHDTNAAFPITFTLDVQRPTELAGLRLCNRAGNQNGRIRDFQIDVSLDNQRWRSCGDSSLPDGPAIKSVKFETPVDARYVRISATSSHAGPVFASLAEIEPIGSRPE